MKIVVNTLSSISKGAEVYLNNVLPGLAELDKENEYLIILDKKHWKDYFIAQNNFHYHVVAFPSESVVLRLIWENFFLPLYLLFLRADLLFTPANICNLLCPCKRVIVVHNLSPFYPGVVSKERLYQKVRLTLLKSLTVFCLNSVDFVILISRHSFDVLKQHLKHPDRFKVIYHGKDEAFKKLSDPSIKGYLKSKFRISGDYLLNISHFYRFKNFENMIKAYADFNRSVGPNCQLVLAGRAADQLYYREIMKLIAETDPAGDRILYLGNLEHDDLIKLLSFCSLFVFPSLHEVCPNTLIEAMACGAPSLVSDSSVMPEICGEAVQYFDPHNVADLTSKMSTVYSDRPFQAELAKKGLARSADFSWQKCATEVYGIFCGLAKGMNKDR